uniref:NADH-ubiquinone oxidoreductase chain 4L n=1 Tax=Physemacris variolosa TaxID=62778 RepID=E0YCJ6_9ORTH|nr:NADH dehydrogenase subunit 4L [Physemacris variolosa]ADD97031.1 NADH dehydrogenase subunit 4L [Physemacris variolosa]
MFMYFYISLFLFLGGIYMFSFSRKHLLMVLLSLEYVTISLFFLIMNYVFWFDYNYFFPVIFLVFSVCEGVVGLSILVSMIRSYGNDFFNSFSFSLC